VLVVGCCPDRAQAERIIRTYCDRQASQSVQANTHQWWSEMLSVLRIETTTRHLTGWERVGCPTRCWRLIFGQDRSQPAQRCIRVPGSAAEARCRLLYLHPEISREHILLHAAQQFLPGRCDAGGGTRAGKAGTGLARAPHCRPAPLGCPYLVYHYVDATGILPSFRRKCRSWKACPSPGAPTASPLPRGGRATAPPCTAIA